MKQTKKTTKLGQIEFYIWDSNKAKEMNRTAGTLLAGRHCSDQIYPWLQSKWEFRKTLLAGILQGDQQAQRPASLQQQSSKALTSGRAEVRSRSSLRDRGLCLRLGSGKWILTLK